ncbi:hypothetical protein AEA09_07020 [Lysinibacillus contaminans]|uniref:Transcription initiation factor TFIIIB n=1 Tax=Lysinibacillus contaminans TaxID=1293441 RepID=A0ABR5K0C0_9BACI|nr:hypothetical protein [Lysinibacillus contaminans]KOS68331.1 hypothetical protein AEA09_07020 [Lysinibacillus contaminans]
MENNNLVCKACGSDSFTTGQVGDASTYGNVKPIGSAFAVGSPFIFRFCKACGEVATIKVAKPEKFK